jgi:nitrite reductase/ring-hydroxylating ferredoxin subunit
MHEQQRQRRLWPFVVAGLALLLLAGVLALRVDIRPWRDLGAIDPAWAETPHAVELDGKSIFLILVDGKVTAFNRQDTYPRGCIVDWEVRGRQFQFIDPCLGSTYTQDGQYIRGPSPRDLDRFPVRVIDNNVSVTTSTVIRGTVRNGPPSLWERMQQWLEKVW